VRGFAGFSSQKEDVVSLPEVLFTQVLPFVDSLGEAKVTLYVFWLIQQKKGFPKCVSLAELEKNELVGQALRIPGSPRPPQDVLREGLELAVARGTFLHLVTSTSLGREDWYFVNTPQNARLVDEMESGQAPVAELLGVAAKGIEVRASVERPNVFVIYEQNIGLLTPIIAEQLREAEKLYPSSWIEEAIGEAVTYNRRSWRYVQRILENWSTRGKDSAKDRR
jgi:DNA replication protein